MYHKKEAVLSEYVSLHFLVLKGRTTASGSSDLYEKGDTIVKVNVCNTILLGRKRRFVSPFMNMSKNAISGAVS